MVNSLMYWSDMIMLPVARKVIEQYPNATNQEHALALQSATHWSLAYCEQLITWALDTIPGM